MLSPRALVMLVFFSIHTLSEAQELLWSDEFRDSGDGPDPAIWSYDVGGGGWSNGELQVYSQENVRVEDGKLVIAVTADEGSLWSGRTFYSGRIRSNEKLEFQYGTVEAKIKVPDVGNGLSPALWMLGTTFPDVAWPMSGEIDIMQLGSARALQLEKATTRVGSAVHWEAFGRIENDYNELDTDFDMAEDYHVYKLEWTPDRITTFVDDQVIVDKNIAPSSCFECEELHQPFFFVLSMAVGGGYTRLYHEQGITAELPAEFMIDYIRIYDNGFTQLSGSFTDTQAESPSTVSIPSPTVAPTSKENRDDEGSTTTNEPSPSPVSLPTTDAPTDPPVTVASSLPIQRLEANGVKMSLLNVDPLDPVAARHWAEVSRAFLSSQVSAQIGQDLVDRVDVSVSIQSQYPPFVLRRKLQDELSAQTIEFDAAFEIQSVVDVNDVNRYIVGAFNTEEKKVTYLSRLQTANEAFADANDVEIAPATSVSRVVENPSNPNAAAIGIGLAVGITLALLAIICLVAAIVYSKRRKRSKKHKPTMTTGPAIRESSTIRAQREDDSLYNLPEADTPSTCEDSLYTSTSKGTLDFQFTCPRTSKFATPSEATVGTSDSDFAKYIDSFRHKDPEPVLDDTDSEFTFTSNSQTYDYSAAYKHAHGSIADSQSQMTGQVTNDDATIVSEFQVRAPPGNLGLILESDRTTGISHIREQIQSIGTAGTRW
jgi:beta-glucanase (GH16 family)